MTNERVDRRGAPSPLIEHLTSALSIYETGAQLAPLAAQSRFPWPTPPNADQRDVAEAASTPDLAMALALRAEAARRLDAMARGVRLYQRHPARRAAPEPPTIWTGGAARLLDYGPPNGAPVFITPSLINSYHILDLDPGFSLIEAFQASGLRPLVLDWGAPGPEEMRFDLAAYIERRLRPAFVSALSVTGAPAMPLIGYCMGGAMAVALAQHLGARVSRLALIGAPWDFSKMTPLRGALAASGLSARKQELATLIEAVTTIFGAIPVEMTQAIFARLDPGLAARKFRRFAALDPDSAEARRFVLIEDWLNGGPPVSGPAAREALIDWHIENLTMAGGWRVFDEPVRPKALTRPALVIAAAKDRITPPGATAPLAEIIPGARRLAPQTGHVGMIVGGSARKAVWTPLADFLREA